MPAEAELKIPSIMSAVGLLSSYMLDIPKPIATPIGVVKEKKIDINVTALVLNLACKINQKIKMRKTKNKIP